MNPLYLGKLSEGDQSSADKSFAQVIRNRTQC
jgi:hypothetical protein